MRENIMVDVETFGTKAGSVIASIGAVKFNESSMLEGAYGVFYEKIDVQSCLDLGLTVDASTISWWLKQTEEARKEIYDPKDRLHIVVALRKFWDFYGRDFDEKKIDPPLIWGNGSDFDLTKMMECAYMKTGFQRTPWEFWDIRDFRTFKCLHGEESLKPNIKTIHHKALDDAIYEATYLMNICKSKRIELK